MTYTIREAAALLKISQDSIYRRLAEFGAVRIGRTYRITDAGLERFIQANRVAAAVRTIRRHASVSRSERLRSARALRNAAIGAARS